MRLLYLLIGPEDMPLVIVRASSAEAALKDFVAAFADPDRYKDVITVKRLDMATLEETLNTKFPDDDEFTILNNADF